MNAILLFGVALIGLADSDGGLSGEDEGRNALKAVLFWGAMICVILGLLGMVIRSAIKSSRR